MNPDFCPSVWKEDLPPPEADAYRECPLCTEKSPIIWGEGNPKAPIMVILDNPGERRDKNGKEYVCGTRQTLQMAIHKVNLKPQDIYLTYLLKCRARQKYNKEKARAFSRVFLVKQVEDMNPRFLVCLGDTVVKTMFSDCEKSVKILRGKWHGIMGYMTMVSYHPLAVRRRPNLLNVFQKDWTMLAKEFFQKD